MALKQEMLEYLSYKIEDEGLDGVVEHGLEYVQQLWPALAAEIEDWSQDGVRLEHTLIVKIHEDAT